MGDSPKWVKNKRRRRERKKRLNDGNNNGQATLGARKHAWRTQAAWANFGTCVEIKIFSNTPGTRGGPGGRDRTLALKRRKTARK